MTNDATNKLQDYKESINKKAEELITQGFPEKIIEFTDLLATPTFSETNLHLIQQKLNISMGDSSLAHIQNAYDYKVSVPHSKDIYEIVCDMIKIVKPIMLKVVEDFNFLKMWVSLMIPKVEDGNNFGVGVQKQILAEIEEVESQSTRFHNEITQYLLSRSRRISKVEKYPHIEDYKRAVLDFDENQRLYFRYVVYEIRNRYAALNDIVTKNIEKLKKPRSSNVESFY